MVTQKDILERFGSLEEYERWRIEWIRATVKLYPESQNAKNAKREEERYKVMSKVLDWNER